MVEWGTNVDPFVTGGDLSPYVGFDSSWCKWVRVVLRYEDQNTYEWFCQLLHELKAQGHKIIAVVARESLTENGELLAPSRWFEWIHGYLHDQYQLHNVIDALEAGNEPDLKSPSSWTMEPRDFNLLLRCAVEACSGPYHILPVISGGLASGQPSYLDAVNLTGVSGLGLHTYTQMPAGWPEDAPQTGNWLNVLLNNYREVTDLPFWITEFGVTTQQWGGRWQGRYLARTVHSLDLRPDVEVACQFCLDDAMVPGWGLYRNGVRKLAGRMYRTAVRGLC